jgi:hypothetical protein
MSDQEARFPGTENIIDRVATINRVTGNSVAIENIEVLLNPETGQLVSISIGEPGELTGIKMSDETQACNGCGSYQWNGEDLPLIFRSGKWLPDLLRGCTIIRRTDLQPSVWIRHR